MINIAILGLGTVGTGVYEILKKRKEKLKKNIGRDIKIKRILVKNIKKNRDIKVEDGVLTTDFKGILEDSEIDIIVEVTSDIFDSYQYIKSSLKAGKHVVTANKAVVSKHFEEFSSLAEENNVAFLYEASVAGGIPILKPLKGQIKLNDIYKVQGILNGTCNYILDEMTEQDLPYDKVLEKAKKLGYAEADPTADVSGEDTMRKLRILSTIILGGKVVEEDIILKGIENISYFDINEFKKKDMIVKLIGEGKKELDGFTAIVQPQLIKKNSYFNNVNGAYNSVTLQGEDVDNLKFYGPGAGKLPTANAVLSDVFDIILEDYNRNSPLGNNKLLNKNENIKGEYYLRITDLKNQDVEEKLKDISKEIEAKDNNMVVWTKEVRLNYIFELLSNVDKEKYFLAKLED